MDNVFFQYLIPINESLGLIERTVLEDNEKEKLHNIIHSMYEHRIVDVILANIDKEHHDLFIQMLATDPYNLQIMTFLKSKNSEIDSLIQDAGKSLHQEIMALLII